MTRLIALTLVLLLSAGLAAAEPLRIPAAVYASATAADLWTTYDVLRRPPYLAAGAVHVQYEANPLGRWLGGKPRALVAFSAAAEIGGWTIGHRLVGKAHPRLERAALYAGAAIHAGFAIHNARLGRSIDRAAVPMSFTYGYAF